MQHTDLSKYNNDWYKKEIGASKVRRALWFLVNVVFFRNSLNPFSSLKVGLLRMFGAKVGQHVTIKPPVNIKYPWKLTIGDYVWIGENVWIDSLAKISIGNNVCLSQGAMLLTGNHDFTSSTFDLKVSPIEIADGAWVGAKSVICPGIKVNAHAVLTVASVATKDLEAYSIYQGNPAVKVKDRKIE